MARISVTVTAPTTDAARVIAEGLSALLTAVSVGARVRVTVTSDREPEPLAVVDFPPVSA